LDSVVREFGLRAVRLVKIDVEGAESVVLSGASALLRELRPYLVVELHTPEQDVRSQPSWVAPAIASPDLRPSDPTHRRGVARPGGGVGIDPRHPLP